MLISVLQTCCIHVHKNVAVNKSGTRTWGLGRGHGPVAWDSGA